MNKRPKKGQLSYIITHPYISLDKEWKGKWLNVLVLVDPKHLNFYMPPKWHVQADVDMSRVEYPNCRNRNYADLIQWFWLKSSSWSIFFRTFIISIRRSFLLLSI